MKNLFSDHLSKERKEKLIDAWQYLKPWQKFVLYVKAHWYALPSVLKVLERIQARVLIWLTYKIYKAHWM